ncbi:uncharacterized protein LOC114876473 isoform X1 [Osmia bicornis bicornis]|uniref:uncharacterized protein LOC114876473 isoform X1 n=1 Tax=Osmia bicornis bicornis TaxID=1437191 RepID=UPI001EAEAE93|nr:uncharacterized protein LOC114876473 isoform X1 [Osmia bicornis bicornis]
MLFTNKDKRFYVSLSLVSPSSLPSFSLRSIKTSTIHNATNATQQMWIKWRGDRGRNLDVQLYRVHQRAGSMAFGEISVASTLGEQCKLLLRDGLLAPSFRWSFKRNVYIKIYLNNHLAPATMFCNSFSILRSLFMGNYYRSSLW